MILSLTCIIALITVFFPKDFYLPFLKSNTLLAHFFFFFGVIGKGCFLVASAWAVIGLFQEHRGISQETVNTSDVTVSNSPQVSLSAHYYWFPWAVWGFAFWTLSMFSGELWSYLGWGTPVVWDDPAITTTMATWFFYICLLHLHLTGTWTARGRTAYAASGILVVLILNYIPQLGPYRWPF
jgi:ABC-type transport system involved in cytochrome c biogenesis permease subunit